MGTKNKIVVIVLALLIMSNTFYVAFTYTYYFIDKEGFIAEYCINVDKPELKCNGKCHLKEVAKEDTTNENVPVKMITTKEVNLFVKEIEKIDFGYIIYTKKQINNYYNLYSYLDEYALFHPPKVSLT